VRFRAESRFRGSPPCQARGRCSSGASLGNELSALAALSRTPDPHSCPGIRLRGRARHPNVGAKSIADLDVIAITANGRLEHGSGAVRSWRKAAGASFAFTSPGKRQASWLQALRILTANEGGHWRNHDRLGRHRGGRDRAAVSQMRKPVDLKGRQWSSGASSWTPRGSHRCPD